MARDLIACAYADAIGLRREARSDGSALLCLEYGPAVRGIPGMFHGGVVGGLLELAAREAMYAHSEGEGDGEAGLRFQTMNLTVNYLRGTNETPLYAAGRVERTTSRLANVRVDAWQADRALPVATGLAIIVPQRPGDASACFASGGSNSSATDQTGSRP